MIKKKASTHIFSKALSVFFAALFSVALFLPSGAPAYALDPPEISHSKGACVYSMDYGTSVYENNADDPVFPAGTVKIMVALLTLEHYKDLSETVTVTEDMIDKELIGTLFEVGEVLTVEQLLASLILGNSNDAAQILAAAVGGNTGAFLKMMNDRAKELGMENTRYFNVTGLHTQPMKTTARDVALVSLEAAKHREYLDLSSSEIYVIPATNKYGERKIRNRNIFVSTYYNLYYRLESVNGLSFSYTGDAGYCMSITATSKKGLSYVFVVMNSDETGAGENEILGCDDCVALMNWAFRNFESVPVVDTGNMICEIPVTLSANTDHVIALPNRKISALLPGDADLSPVVRTEYTLKSETLTAPVSAGEVIGELTVYVNGEEYGKADLVAKNNVDRSMWAYLGYRIGKFFSRPSVIVVAVLVAVLLIFAGIVSSIRRSNRAKRVKSKK
ncbi:MAG: D-alanyl-D-alanine carboxypeptidase [Clostridia bacterium]|nr:D-alanyl-D-alanine carboxypeptidase [Clostridia bacterium]